MSEPRTDRTRLTFSQAEGIDLLPQPAALGELPRKARVFLWNITYLSLEKSTSRWSATGSRSIIMGPWETILRHYHVFLLNRPADEFSPYFDYYAREIKKLFLDGDYNRVFDFLQCVLRDGLASLRPVVASVLKECMCAYTVVEDGPITTVVPIALPEQRESMQEAFRVLKSGPFEGARAHLRKSAECIN